MIQQTETFVTANHRSLIQGHLLQERLQFHSLQSIVYGVAAGLLVAVIGMWLGASEEIIVYSGVLLALFITHIVYAHIDQTHRMQQQSEIRAYCDQLHAFRLPDALPQANGLILIENMPDAYVIAEAGRLVACFKIPEAEGWRLKGQVAAEILGKIQTGLKIQESRS